MKKRQTKISFNKEILEQYLKELDTWLSVKRFNTPISNFKSNCTPYSTRITAFLIKENFLSKKIISNGVFNSDYYYVLDKNTLDNNFYFFASEHIKDEILNSHKRAAEKRRLKKINEEIKEGNLFDAPEEVKGGILKENYIFKLRDNDGKDIYIEAESKDQIYRIMESNVYSVDKLEIKTIQDLKNDIINKLEKRLNDIKNA